MYCQKCGTQHDDNSYRCVQCGELLQHREVGGAAPEHIPNYLAQSILVTIFCCVPFGIPAIVFAAQVNSKILAGDIPGAMECSRKARLWAWWAFGVGLVFGVLYVLLIIVTEP